MIPADELAAIKASLAVDGSLPPLIPNETVTFENPLTPDDSPLTADVMIEPATQDAQMFGWEPGVYYKMVFDPALPIDRDWTIRSTDITGIIGGVLQGVSLRFVERRPGILPIGVGYFVVPG